MLLNLVSNREILTSIYYNWYGASDFDISNYCSCTRSELSKIKLPLEAMQCEDVLCNKHRRDIDVFYSAITNCLHGQCCQLGSFRMREILFF